MIFEDKFLFNPEISDGQGYFLWASISINTFITTKLVLMLREHFFYLISYGQGYFLWASISINTFITTKLVLMLREHFCYLMPASLSWNAFILTIVKSSNRSVEKENSEWSVTLLRKIELEEYSIPRGGRG